MIVNATMTANAERTPSKWVTRIIVGSVAVIAWAALRYVIGPALMPTGPDEPLTVFLGGGLLSAIIVLVVLVVAGLIAELALGRPGSAPGIVVAGIALALWAYAGGTMDQWLCEHNAVPGPASGGAYWPLLAEYIYWAVVIGLLVLLAGWRASQSYVGESGRPSLPAALGIDTSPDGLRDGLTALVVTTAVTAIVAWILMGPRLGHTYRGQVYFATAVGCILGVFAAERVSHQRSIVWFLPAPILVGIIGVVYAAMRPGLAVPYDNINVIPAWGLARALPIEMVSVGSVAILLTLGTVRRLSSESNQA